MVKFNFWGELILATPNYAQGLILALCSGVFSGSSQDTICSTRNLNWVYCGIQGKRLKPYAIFMAF